MTNLSLKEIDIHDESSLDQLRSLFGSLSSLYVTGVGSVILYGVNGVSCMKFLEKWGGLKSLMLSVGSVPSDCLSTLQYAGLQRRPFVLTLVARDNACRDRLQLTADQWQVSQQFHPDVCLKVG